MVTSLTWELQPSTLDIQNIVMTKTSRIKNVHDFISLVWNKKVTSHTSWTKTSLQTLYGRMGGAALESRLTLCRNSLGKTTWNGQGTEHTSIQCAGLHLILICSLLSAQIWKMSNLENCNSNTDDSRVLVKSKSPFYGSFDQIWRLDGWSNCQILRLKYSYLTLHHDLQQSEHHSICVDPLDTQILSFNEFNFLCMRNTMKKRNETELGLSA
jgi:hypothetical protein